MSPMYLTLNRADLITFRFTCTRKSGAGALLQSKLDNKCIRVFRSSNLSNSRWKPAPAAGSTVYRYDGLYTIVDCMSLTKPSESFAQDVIPSGDTSSFTFRLTRCDTQSTYSNAAFMKSIQSTLLVSNQSELRLAHKIQEKKRKLNGWLPAGRLQRQRPKQVDYLKDDGIIQQLGNASCSRDLKDQLPKIITNSMTIKGFKVPIVRPIRLLSDLNVPVYLEPSRDLLHVTRLAIEKFIPSNDLECLESMLCAREHVMHWKPTTVKVILLAESHAHTPRDLVVGGPSLPSEYLPQYTGPRGFIAHVNCLLYGENDLTSPRIANNTGSAQFWQLLGVCAYGYDYYASDRKKELTHTWNKNQKDRLKCKYNLLVRLRSLGIWLLDTNVFGWYITQQQEFVRKSCGVEVTRKAKQRPPTNLKSASLTVSWEMYTKHVVHKAAVDGNLKAIIPIGKEVAKAITISRMKEAVNVGNNSAVVERIPPAPNAWIEGGYGPILEKISSVVKKHI